MLTTQLLLQLFGDTSTSWARMLIALGASMLLSLILGIWMARSHRVERVLLPFLDILQTLPILTFFPFVIYVFVFFLPGYIGINASVIFLIMTSMLWNMIFGVYEAIKTLPSEMMEVTALYGMGVWKRLRTMYIPAAMPRLSEQSILSWSIGLFYLVTSEIFSVGNQNYSVAHGIGVDITTYAFSGNFTAYAVALGVFILFVLATRYLLFIPMEKHFTKYYEAGYKPTRLQNRRANRFRLFRALAFEHSTRRRRMVHEHYKHLQAKAEFQPEVLSKSQNAYLWHSIKIFSVGITIIIAIFAIYAQFFNPVLFSYEYNILLSLVYSFSRVWLTFLIILLVAAPVSVYLVFMSRHSNSFISLFQVLASIPATIVLPIIIVLFQSSSMSGEMVAFSVFFLSGIWYVIFSVLGDAKTIQSNINDVKRVFKVHGWKAWRQIYLPAVLPGLITGAVTGIAAEWNASIVAEYFTSTGISGGSVVTSVNTGIGKLLDIALGQGNLTLMLLALLNLTLMIILINTFVWKRLYRRVSDMYR